jgi:lipid A 3-O-deacylase
MNILLRTAAFTVLILSFVVMEAGAEEQYLFGEFGQIGKNADKLELQLGLLSYDTGLFTHQDFNGAVLNGEILFPSPDFLAPLGSPRPHLGFDAALVDDPIHFAYAGLTWDVYFTKWLYLSASFGGALTTAQNLEDPTEYKALGCRGLFHVGAGLGFDITEKATVQLYADHFSTASLCEPNNGAENAGIRFGYRF